MYVCIYIYLFTYIGHLGLLGARVVYSVAGARPRGAHGQGYG